MLDLIPCYKSVIYSQFDNIKYVYVKLGCSVTRVPKHGGDTLPSVEVKDADVFIGGAGGHILT